MRAIKIVSGGQTGADRSALDFAIKHGFDHGGWCPKGRKAEDGPLPQCYRLDETSSSQYAQRTEFNVRDSDGTVVFTISPEMAAGSLKTFLLARKHGKPVLHIPKNGGAASPAQALHQFLREHRIAVLNVAGPRASDAPEIGEFVKEVLSAALLTEEVAQPRH